MGWKDEKNGIGVFRGKSQATVDGYCSASDSPVEGDTKGAPNSTNTEATVQICSALKSCISLKVVYVSSLLIDSLDQIHFWLVEGPSALLVNDEAR